jgi:arsenate reductase
MNQMPAKQRVLFLCTGNSCRSQMAEGFVNYLRPEHWQAFSAGSQPSGYVHPLAIQAMAEVGIDISSHRSKSVVELRDQPLDLVITVCDNAAKNCPVWLGKEKIAHIGFEDPAEAEGTLEQKMMVFRNIRDQIQQIVIDYLDRQTFAASADTSA